MALLPASLITDLLIVATTLSIAIYTYFCYVYKYWEKRSVPFLPPTFPLGNSPSFFIKSISYGLDEAVQYYEEIKKQGHKFAGIFTMSTPVLVVVDPDYIRDVLTKDFQYFMDRGFYHNEKDDPISAHLFAMDGAKWKNLRNKLTPSFTSGKMKMMVGPVLEYSEYMVEAIDKCAKENSDIDIKEFLSSFTVDVIGRTAFGIECNSFKNPNAPFRMMGNIVSEVEGYLHLLKLMFISKLPTLALKLGLIGTRKDVSKFYTDVLRDSVRYREENDVSRVDFLQLLIELRNSTKDSENPFTVEQMAAQAFVFFIAGFETSSTTMTFVCYELARNPRIQEKVRREIEDVLERHLGQITYESLAEMKYLTQVVDETLRVYPPVHSLIRTCVKDYKVRDSNVIIEKGTPVLIPTMGLHRDPDHYPDPEKFDPDRFSNESRDARHSYSYLPFGEGPRNCIGMRFALMQSKIGLIAILRKFRLRISPKTQMPLHLDPDQFLIKTLETLYLKAEII